MKTIPIHPTPAMVQAAEEAYMPFGDMELAIKLAILEAPCAWQPIETAPEGKTILVCTASCGVLVQIWPSEQQAREFFSGYITHWMPLLSEPETGK